jgi:hypothetical protein
MTSTRKFEINIYRELNEAYSAIQHVYEKLKFLIDNERDLKEKDRHDLYTYGIDKATFDVVRLVNIKKSLEAIDKKVKKYHLNAIDIDT